MSVCILAAFLVSNSGEVEDGVSELAFENMYEMKWRKGGGGGGGVVRVSV